jgi:hypothetical protein
MLTVPSESNDVAESDVRVTAGSSRASWSLLLRRLCVSMAGSRFWVRWCKYLGVWCMRVIFNASKCTFGYVFHDLSQVIFRVAMPNSIFGRVQNNRRTISTPLQYRAEMSVPTSNGYRERWAYPGSSLLCTHTSQPSSPLSSLHRHKSTRILVFSCATRTRRLKHHRRSTCLGQQR